MSNRRTKQPTTPCRLCGRRVSHRTAMQVQKCVEDWLGGRSVVAGAPRLFDIDGANDRMEVVFSPGY